MNLICKLFRQNPDSREGVISATSALGVVVNVIIAIVKVIIGMLTSSIAIISEGANGAADALSSLLTLIGTKLARRRPDEKHPFGYGRIEYLVSLVISVMILVTGTEMLTNSVKLIFHPEELHVSYLAILIVAVSAVIKFSLGLYTIKVGKATGSGALVGVGTESRNDAFASVITITSSLIYLFFHVSLDAYAGLLISAMILRAGVELLRNTLGDLIGRPGEHELAQTLYHEIRRTEGIVCAADMMLHNYGPDAWSGSVNVEFDHKRSVGEIYTILHELQLRIRDEYKVTMVFGVYAVDNDHAEVRTLRKTIGQFIQDTEHVESFHALYMNSESRRIYCDIVVDYALDDWDALRERFEGYLKELYPDYAIELTIETEYVG